MTEVARLDRVLHWKDVGGGMPAEGLIVDVGEGGPPGAPRITPNFLWRDNTRVYSARRSTWTTTRVTPRRLLYLDNVDGESWLILFPSTMEDARAAGVGATLTPPDLSLSTLTIAQLQPLVIDEGAAIPQAVIDAEDSLSAGATYSALWNRTPTLRVSWVSASGVRFVQDLAVDQAIWDERIGGPWRSARLRLDIPRNQPNGSTSQERFNLLQLHGQATIEALPVYWQDLQSGQTPEGAFTARKLFARRDDSQVENVEYDQSDDGSTQVTIQRVTAFTCRQEAVPPLDTILSEHNLWDGSEGTWQLQSVELLDRGRTARLQCVEYTGS